MKRILQVTSQLARNGTETFIMNVFRNINRDKVTFDFLLSSESTDGYYEEAKSLGAAIYHIPSRRHFLWHHKALNNFFKNNAHKYAAIHYNGNSFTSITVFYYAKLYGVPVRIAHSHNSRTDGIHNIILHHINRVILPFLATDFFACSDLAADWAYKHTSAQKKCKVINNGIDLEKFFYAPDVRKKKRTEFGIEGKWVIGAVGRLTTVKNHTFLLDVFHKIWTQNKDTVLIIVGEGELRNDLTNKIKNLGLEGAVLLLGVRTDISEIMQAFDVFAMPSLYEGLGIACLEGQASSLQCIVSDRLPLEVDITGNVHFLSLEDIDKWLEALSPTLIIERNVVDNSPRLQAYNIKTTVKVLEETYLRE